MSKVNMMAQREADDTRHALKTDKRRWRREVRRLWRKYARDHTHPSALTMDEHDFAKALDELRDKYL